jgi:hypothetical protein
MKGVLLRVTPFQPATHVHAERHVALCCRAITSARGRSARPTLAPKPPEVISPTCSPGVVHDRLPLADRPLAVHGQAHAASPRAGGKLRLDMRPAPGVAPGAVAIGPPRAADRPGESRLHRGDRRCQLVPVETQAGLEAQRVPGTESDRLHLIVRQQHRAAPATCLPAGRRSRSRPRRCSRNSSHRVSAHPSKLAAALQKRQRGHVREQPASTLTRAGPCSARRPAPPVLAQRWAGLQI